MIKLLLWIIFLILIVLFVVFNVDPKVSVRLLPGVSLEGIPLALVIIFSFILGFLLGLLLVYPQLLKAKFKMYQWERKARLSNLEEKEPTKIDKENA
ncbi:MAG: lipopolysaccharide assembly protein LapA domain-containing protein [Caldimicrobium sp.]